MEGKIEWYFPDNRGGQEEGFENQGINQFKMSPYGKLAREIIQNSYDAKKNENTKVIVEFNLMKVEKSKIPNLDQINNNIKASSDFFPNSERLKKFAKNANEKYNRDEIDVLKISDYNTTGLVGIEERENSAWYGLIKSSGNSTKSGVTGGSYGSGKHAAFVFSYFRTILYGTYVDNEGYAFQGKSILCTHRENDIIKSNIGYWGNIDNYECKPIRNQYCLDEIYRRNESGTDLYIIGAKLDNKMWASNIFFSVIENFWKLIIQDKLEVRIVNYGLKECINSKNIRGYAKLNRDFRIDDHDAFNAYKFIELDDKIKEVRYGSICEENDVELKIAKLPDYNDKKILKMRDTQMKISIYSPRKRPIDFIGILEVKGEEINKQLRESEPQTHDAWNADNIEDEDYRKIVKKTIKELDKWLNEQIDSLSNFDNSNEFDAEGLDFLTLEEDDDNDDGIEDLQRPFDEILNDEGEQEEIIRTQKIIEKKNGIDKTKDIAPKAGGENEGEEERFRGEGHKSQGVGKNNTGSGESFHELKMKYIKTPFDHSKNKYRIIINSMENVKNCEVHFLRCTDSGELEKIKIKEAMINGETQEIYSNIVKNVNLKELENRIIEVEFESNRKCIMEVKVYVQD